MTALRSPARARRAALRPPAASVAARRARRGRVRIAGGAAHRCRSPAGSAPVDAADRAVLEHALAPVLDIGCGPGPASRRAGRRRARRARPGPLPRRGAARTRARRRGDPALRLRRRPRAGTWRTALLLDGNIGIGGRPARCCARARALVARGGRGAGRDRRAGTAPPRAHRVRLESHGAMSPWFGWATVGADALAALALAAGLAPREQFAVGGRWFAQLERRR